MIDQSSKVRDEGNNGVTDQRLKVIVKSINRDQNSWVRVQKSEFRVLKIRVPISTIYEIVVWPLKIIKQLPEIIISW